MNTTLSVSKNCEVCNKEFFKTKSTGWPEWNRRKFCSRRCINVGRVTWNKGKEYIAIQGERNPNYKGPRLCEQCGGEYKRTGLSRRFCSQACWQKANQNENNPHWKGEGASMSALHSWVKRYLGKPQRCEHCGATDDGKQYQWANKSGEYKRDLTDWLRLCVSCHKKYDFQKVRNLLCEHCREIVEKRISILRYRG